MKIWTSTCRITHQVCSWEAPRCRPAANPTLPPPHDPEEGYFSRTFSQLGPNPAHRLLDTTAVSGEQHSALQLRLPSLKTCNHFDRKPLDGLLETLMALAGTFCSGIYFSADPALLQSCFPTRPTACPSHLMPPHWEGQGTWRGTALKQLCCFAQNN